MYSIYFDKQIFSFLHKGGDERIRRLKQLIDEGGENFAFFYSHAHLMDLANDHTDWKFSELVSMQSVVKGNYLQCNDDGILLCRNCSPMEAFWDAEFRSHQFMPENVDEAALTRSNKKIMLNLWDLFVKDLHRELSHDWMLEREPREDVENLSVNDFMEVYHYLSENFYGHAQLYKSIRENAIRDYNPFLTIAKSGPGACSDGMLKDTPLKMSFRETVYTALKQVGFEEVPDIMAFTFAYIVLDMIGLSKEPGKKIKFGNLLVDGCHAYYASNGDCLVSEDQGLRKKASALYELYGISTKVYSLDEFLDVFETAIQNNRKSKNEFLMELLEDFNKAPVLDTLPLEDGNYKMLKSNHLYFGYFDTLIKVVRDTKVFCSLSRKVGYGHFLTWHEIGYVVNRLGWLLRNPASGFYIPFDFYREVPLIVKGQWEGRRWEFSDAKLVLALAKDQKNLFLTIDWKELIDKKILNLK